MVNWKELKEEVKHLQETGIPRCINCKKNFEQETQYSWKPTCGCYEEDIRISIR